MSTVEAAAGKAQAMVRDSVKTVIAASMVGTAIEFYDFYAYGTAAANYFPKVFFGDTTNPTVALLASLLTFAIAFIARPLGSLVFGHFGDRMGRKTTLVVSLLTIALAPNIHLILFTSLLTGACSVIPQVFMPLAAQYSTPETKGKNVGIILSGLLTGILASRVVSGIVGEYMGWRFIYFVAAGLMVVCLIVIIKILPDLPSNFQGTYFGLMKSLFSLVRKYPQLRIVSLRAGFSFGSFLAMWSCLAFKMEQAPFFAGNNIIGMLGLCGIAGALTASSIGRYIHILGVKRLTYIGCTLIISAWITLYVGQYSYVGIIAGILLIDIGMQCIQLSNQTSAFALCPQASNRINTIFMTTYFIGGSTGTFLAGTSWQYFGWTGVIGTGILLTSCSLVINIFAKK